MRKALLAALALLLPAEAIAACANPMKREVMMMPGFMRTPVPEAVPDIAFTREDGREARLADLAGAPSIVSFWFPGCPGCAQETPALNAMRGRYADRPGLNLLSVSVQGSERAVRTYLDRRGAANIEAHRDEGAALFTDLCLAATPVHVILDAEARMVGALVGPQDWGSDTHTEFLDELIEKGWE